MKAISGSKASQECFKKYPCKAAGQYFTLGIRLGQVMLKSIQKLEATTVANFQYNYMTFFLVNVFPGMNLFSYFFAFNMYLVCGKTSFQSLMNL